MSTIFDILGLTALYACDIDDAGDHLLVQVKNRAVPTACPDCGCALYRHEVKKQQFIDTPMRGKPVMLELDRVRYKCKACSLTFYEPLPDIDAKRMMTERALRYIEVNCVKHTFAHVAKELGISPKTVRFIFDDYAERNKVALKFETPEVLGIDELKIVGEYRCMITNVGKMSIFDLLPTRKKASLLEYMHALPDKENVKVITMDMWNVYRQVAQECFPGRVIVADKFHVVRMANDGLERVRKRLRKGLDSRARLKLKRERFILLRRHADLSPAEHDQLLSWSAMFHELGAAHAVKEGFFDIYDAPTKEEAQERARAWLRRIPEMVQADFKPLVTALNSWWNEIFAWFDYPVTNAYTESVNRLAKDMNRMGRGYSFEVVRARLLTDQEARKATASVIRSKPRGSRPSGELSMGRMVPSILEPIERVVEYGPHIPTLCRLLEEGHFE